MARSHLTLAALATAAVPGLRVLGSGPLRLSGSGDFDSALVRSGDDRDLVVRVPSNDRAAGEQAIELIALQAMTPGIRSRLPFTVPTIIGQAASDPGRVAVTEYLPGYQVAAEHIPAGDGVATSIGGALAAIHSLPAAFVTDAGLPSLTAAQCRNEALNVIERASATRRLPAAIRTRWSEAARDDALWQFHPVVTNGTISAESFLITDYDVGPIVSGVVGWGGLRVGDPARDLHWLSAAPEGSESVYAAYRAGCTRAPDRFLRQRSLLHAELELARWLLHGLDTRDSTIIEDAVGLLDGLVDNVLGDLSEDIHPAVDPVLAVADVEDLLSKTPDMPRPSAPIGMETDAFEFTEAEFGDSDHRAEALGEDADGAATAEADETDLTVAIDDFAPDEAEAAPITDADTGPITLPRT